MIKYLNFDVNEHDIAAISNTLYAEGMTDGLPVIPPTRERVDWMLKGTNLDPETVIAEVGPRRGQATVRAIAANAVLAGCEPEYLPFVIAAIKACTTGDYWHSDRRFILSGVVATANNCAVATIASGPLCEKVKIQAGQGCMGSGFKANASIGRAIQLVLRNVGGAAPGITDFSQVGQSGKFSFFFAENEADLPENWKPFRIQRGFDKDTTTVTTIALEPPYHVLDQLSRTAQDLALMFAIHLARPANISQGHPGEALLIVGPQHSERFARDGWSKEDLQEFIYHHARVPVNLIAEEFVYLKGGVEIIKGRGPLVFREWPKWITLQDSVPICKNPDHVLVIVAGGPGNGSMVSCPWSHSLSVTEAVDPYVAR